MEKFVNKYLRTEKDLEKNIIDLSFIYLKLKIK